MRSDSTSGKRSGRRSCNGSSAEGVGSRDLDDRPRLARVLVWQGNLDMLAGYPTESFQKLREGYEIAVDIGDEGLALSRYSP
jgi:hypothetical protein